MTKNAGSPTVTRLLFIGIPWNSIVLPQLPSAWNSGGWQELLLPDFSRNIHTAHFFAEGGTWLPFREGLFPGHDDKFSTACRATSISQLFQI